MTIQTFDEISDPAQGAARIAALRGRLAEIGLDGFIVPRSDEHQNEYCPPSEERLAWLTGFAGSAGVAAILKTEASIFVDGRYTVQVRDEVDTAVVTPRHLVEEPIDKWLGATLQPGQKLGYDARLHTIAEVERLKAAAERAGATLVAVERNPVDEIWPDRPLPPLAKVVIHDEALAGESAAAKLARLREKLGEARADALFTNDAHAVAWAFNIRGGDVAHTPLPLSFALIPREGEPTLFVDGRKLSNAVRDELSTLTGIAEPSRLAEMSGKVERGQGRQARSQHGRRPFRDDHR